MPPQVKKYSEADTKRVIDLTNNGLTLVKIRGITGIGKNAIQEMRNGRYGCKRNETYASRRQKALLVSAFQRLSKRFLETFEPLGLELRPRHLYRYQQVMCRRRRLENRRQGILTLIAGDKLKIALLPTLDTPRNSALKSPRPT